MESKYSYMLDNTIDILLHKSIYYVCGRLVWNDSLFFIKMIH